MDEEVLGMNEIGTPANIRAYIAELLGTMMFVLIGTGTIIAGGDLVAIAVAHGLGIAVMIYATTKISGGHINPAVTLAMMVTKRMKIAPGVIYIGAQLLGGLLATTLLYLALNNSAAGDFGAHRINTDLVAGDGGALLIEILLTSMLIAVILAVAAAKNGYGVTAPLMIGLAVMAIHFVALEMTGASVNPARTFGPALISNAFDSFWVYILGPAIGAILAATLYQHVFKIDAEDDAAA